MSDLDGHYLFRDEVARRLRLDILGPVGGPGEILTEDPPLSVYSTGILFPRRAYHTPVSLERRNGDVAGGGVDEKDLDLTSSIRAVDEQPDTGVALANIQNPMSMGMTFAVDPAIAPVIRVQAQAAVYEPVDEFGAPAEPRRAERRSTSGQGLHWRRRQLDIEPFDVDVTESFPVGGLELAPGLLFKARVREPVEGAVAVTVTMLNVNETEGFELLSDGKCFFQVSLEVSAPDEGAPFIERPAPAGSADAELLLTRMLYRHAPVFATGHGCAATWEWKPALVSETTPSSRRAAVPIVRTEFVPSTDVPLTESNRKIDVSGLGMHRLGTDSAVEAISTLRRLLEAYSTWISERMVEAEWLSAGEFGPVARRQIQLCSQALERMREGVELLANDEKSFLAFQLANLAMSQQRARTKWIKEGRTGEPVEDGQWRPFQICFLLLCLAGINDPEHSDRGVADVLWFPTGGGKTEAYLGLIAYTVFLRRLRLEEAGAGVTVIMRYTLRLLTLQQFERAAALLCAMELMRQRDVKGLGTEQMSIGMWVGRAATPNKLADARKSIALLRAGGSLREQNPVQLRACPWCGTPLDANDYDVPMDDSRMDIVCRNGDCEFHSGLPVHVVDEAIYRARPTLIIATADKFAQIAWRQDVAALFNRTGAVPGTPPPELIIQDELHLISGPLGTLAGLYETAVDLAANRPKVIASTATIRRAEEQGAALFNRVTAQFPPAGLDARDSWFAVEAPRSRVPARMYLGLMTPSTSQATLLIQSYASLLHHAKAVEGGDGVRDPYWTLIGYFNSLRLLAAAELQVQDDVVAQLELLGHRDGVAPRSVDATRELTSRVDSSDIPKTLKDLERQLGGGVEPFDVVLATNMISVGVDVDRLGVMSIMGQPQMTAEYIQASSRVGRRYPGLAVVLYNSARSRDRSHYENFTAYHSALYRQVESTSVTPFSARARDRALHAAYVGAARMLYPAARDNTAAARVGTFLDELAKLRTVIVERVSRAAAEEAVATMRELELFTEEWVEMAAVNPDLVYEAAPRTLRSSAPRREDAALLCTHADDDLKRGWPTLWSLRDVDVEADLYLEK
ncbi:putative DNA-binding protein (UPF0251 family) [Catenulispora sp. MAP5-51]|uniref:helicase-related protein n=1 Tax=Catenulispora sp. MAP5-51 TaxID=3156298 RepID=UPI003513E5A7